MMILFDTSIVARVRPGTSKGITDLLSPRPYSGLQSIVKGTLSRRCTDRRRRTNKL